MYLQKKKKKKKKKRKKRRSCVFVGGGGMDPKRAESTVHFQSIRTVEPRYLELAYFELPLISK